MFRYAHIPYHIIRIHKQLSKEVFYYVFSICFVLLELGIVFLCPRPHEKSTVTHPYLSSLNPASLEKQQHNKFNVFKIDDTLMKNQAMWSGFIRTCQMICFALSSLLFQVNSRSFKFYSILFQFPFCLVL